MSDDFGVVNGKNFVALRPSQELACLESQAPRIVIAFDGPGGAERNRGLPKTVVSRRHGKLTIPIGIQAA